MNEAIFKKDRADPFQFPEQDNTLQDNEKDNPLSGIGGKPVKTIAFLPIASPEDEPNQAVLHERLSGYLSHYHIRCLIEEVENQKEAVFRCEERIRARNVDAFILTNLMQDDERVALLDKMNVPYVTLGRSDHQTRSSHSRSLSLCLSSLMDRTIDHLRALGHRRIGLIGSDRHYLYGSRILEAYGNAMQRHAIADIKPLSLFGHMHFDRAFEAIDSYLALNPETTALVIDHATASKAALAAAELHDRSIPDDLSLIGLHLSPSQNDAIPISTFQLEIDALAAQIARLASSLWEETPEPVTRLFREVRFISRGTDGPAPVATASLSAKSK
jgi:LacI family transcriptional regulator